MHVEPRPGGGPSRCGIAQRIEFASAPAGSVPSGHFGAMLAAYDGQILAPARSESRPARREHRGQDHHLLHVRVPLRHPRAPARRRDPLHRRQSGAPAQQGRDLRQGRERHHEAAVAGAPDAPAEAQARAPSAARASSSRSPGTRPSRFSRNALGKDPSDRPEEIRALHRARPDAGAHGPVRAPVRHAELRRARRLLLREHGRRHDLHHRRLVLGVRRAGPRARASSSSCSAPPRTTTPIRSRSRSRSSSARGGRFISINPVRTGYSAIADEWVPIRPGTDGALLLALTHEMIAQGLYDREFVARYTNGGQLVDRRSGLAAPRPARRPTRTADPGNPLYPQNQLWWDRHSNGAGARATRRTPTRACSASSRSPTARRVQPAFQLLADRVRAHTPEWAEGITGIPAATIRRLAHEMGVTARDEKIELPIAWTDCWGERAPDGHRQSGRLPRHARPRGAFERLPDGARARHPDEPARHHRPARAASGTRRRSRAPSRPRRKTPDRARGRAAEHAARGARARLARLARGPVRRRRRRPGAHRQGASPGSTRSRCTA